MIGEKFLAFLTTWSPGHLVDILRISTGWIYNFPAQTVSSVFGPFFRNNSGKRPETDGEKRKNFPEKK